MFKVHNKNTRTGVFTVNFKTYFIPFYSVFIVNFEQVNVSWVITSPITKVQCHFKKLT